MLSDVIPKGYITGFERKLVLSFLWLHGFFSPQWYAFGADHSGWVRFRIDLAQWFFKMCYWKIVAEPWKDIGILGLWRKRIQSGASDEAWLLRAFCNRVLLKYKRDRESFCHKHYKGDGECPPKRKGNRFKSPNLHMRHSCHQVNEPIICYWRKLQKFL